MVIRDAEERDFSAVLALNEGSVHVLAPMTGERLEKLHHSATLHLVLEERGEVVGFVLAFREGIEHDSVNYRWFAERYQSFLYVDRVVVAPDARARGAGSTLYERLFAYARETDVVWVAAEFDVAPPNPASACFHAKFGFHEVGRQVVPYGMKEVSMQIADSRVTRGHEAPSPGTVAADFAERRTGAGMTEAGVVGGKADVAAVAMAGDGIEGVMKRVLVSPADGWDGWVMRLFDVDPGGHTPKHSHDWPHVNFVASGRGTLFVDGADHPLEAGSYAYVPAGHEHQFRAAADAPLSFVCIVPEGGDY